MWRFFQLIKIWISFYFFTEKNGNDFIVKQRVAQRVFTTAPLTVNYNFLWEQQLIRPLTIACRETVREGLNTILHIFIPMKHVKWHNASFD